MSSIKTTQIDGDVSVGRHVALGGDARVSGDVIVGHNVVIEGWLDAPNIKGGNKGLFASVDDLLSAYPHAEAGWFAGVGTSSPFSLYVCRDGEWVSTGGELSITVDLVSLYSLLSSKVDKEAGKGLSTNDYTTAEKKKLSHLENYDDTYLRSAITALSDNLNEILSSLSLLTCRIPLSHTGTPDDSDVLDDSYDFYFSDMLPVSSGAYTISDRGWCRIYKYRDDVLVDVVETDLPMLLSVPSVMDESVDGPPSFNEICVCRRVLKEVLMTERPYCTITGLDYLMLDLLSGYYHSYNLSEKDFATDADVRALFQ